MQLRRVLRILKSAHQAFLFPWPILAFFRSSVGQEYGIGLADKLKLLYQLRRNSVQPNSATAPSIFLEHVYIVTRLLEVPRTIEGAVAEFGCFKGFSTASLSLACALTKRRLIVFDSFEGLPEPTAKVRDLVRGKELDYEPGQYAGTLDEVKSNVERFGDSSVCEFVKGYFDDTLPHRDGSERFVLIFEDADLPESVRSVLQWTWRKLQDECTFFSHEARDGEVVAIFFDKAWWAETIGETHPGFIGSGVGIMTGPSLDWCCLGYTVRRARMRASGSDSELAEGEALRVS